MMSKSDTRILIELNNLFQLLEKTECKFVFDDDEMRLALAELTIEEINHKIDRLVSYRIEEKNKAKKYSKHLSKLMEL